MSFLHFRVAPNLTEANLVEGHPWDFCVDENDPVRKMPKTVRRSHMLKPTTQWNIYSAIRGLASNQRIAKDNPPVAASALVVDYDMVANIDTVIGYINQMPKSQQPNFIEVSLSGKIRLIWVFEREVLTPSTEFCVELLKTFCDKLNAATLLAGFDAASLKPTEMWTNGGVWYDVNPNPLPWTFCFGVACEVSKKTSLFNNGEIPLDIIAEEVKKRFPTRWTGDFALDSIGVRFWDDKADNPTGCQVKPDGCLCFTGKEPFVKWEQIFGRAWVEEQRVLNLGRAAENIFFDGKNYWEQQAGRWLPSSRVDVVLRLKGRGLSDRTARGATQSDVERVLDHLQQVNRVLGAASLINYPPGLVEFNAERLLNTQNLRPVKPIAGTGDPLKDFPWMWAFMNGLFPRPELKPLDHFLCWTRRSYDNVLNYEKYNGQAVFICGPKNNGKTLLCLKIIKPLLGNKDSNPIDYLTGDTNFNDDLFEAALLAVNDEDSPRNDAARARMLAKLKGLVVNPTHKHHAKFDKRFTIEWLGRIFVTLNDDPGAVGMLMEVSQNTRDKQMFFATQPYKGTFPPKKELEAIIAKELPYFAHWLLYVYQPPADVLSDDRMGVNSYFDPHILELANQQTFSSNLSELLQVWMRVDSYWDMPENKNVWQGTPTDLLSALQNCESTAGVARDWSQQKVAKSLTALAKQEKSGIEFTSDTGRDFKITRPE